MNQDGLELGAEEQVFPVPRDVERFDTHAIACQHEAARRGGPQPNREHSAQFAERIRIPFDECVQNCLGVAVRVKKKSQALQLFTKVKMIVDLAVEDDGGVAIIGLNWLVAGGEVENLETCGAHRA